jgi:alkylhydroperoxidase/carboxymuconolactone decarboxylase family protein YurZ
MALKSDEKISDALGIEHIPESKTEVMVPEKDKAVAVHAADAEQDYQLARETFHNIIKKGHTAIEELSFIANQTESARVYEVLATLMKTMGDASKDLYDLQKKTKELHGITTERPVDQTQVHVDKAVFVGTTAELLKKVRNNENV